MKVLKGIISNEGTALGKLYIFGEDVRVEKQYIHETDRELEKLKNAVSCVQNYYKKLIEQAEEDGNDVTVNILDAQLSILGDNVIFDKIGTLISSKHLNAEYACIQVGEETAEEFEKMDSEYMRARSEDFRAVTKKLAGSILGLSDGNTLSEPCIIYAKNLSPEQIISIGKEKILGMVSEEGSAVSHTAILAGTYGIPYIYGIKTDSPFESGTDCAIDANNGLFIIEPDSETKGRLSKQAEEEAAAANAFSADESFPVRLYANISGSGDIDAVLKNNAEGIGLFRTEFLFMNRKELPTEEEQFEAYKKVLEKLGEREVIIRTIDIGTDKQTECLPLPKEENPALGRRAIRICLDDTELFRTQLRAIFRAAPFGNACIMYPMITSCDELDEISAQAELAAKELDERNEKYSIPKQGIMIETPAAALISNKLAEKAAFFSIGTNDLTQYTLALDRQAQGLDRYYNANHEAVYRLIKMTVDNAHNCGIPVGVCGELAGNAKAIKRLVQCGVDELSMSPAKLNKARNVLRKLQKEIEESIEKLTAPADGELIPMEDIPDEAFSSGVLGKCIAVEPENNNIYAPCDGTVTMVADTYHAFGIKSAKGNEILIHIGIDTVSLKGAGFNCGLKVGQTVKKGELLMTADIKKIRKKGLSSMVIMVYDQN